MPSVFLEHEGKTMKSQIQLLSTAWMVWKLATKRVGPVGGLVVTVAVIAGLIYLRPWLVENIPAARRFVGDTSRSESVLPDRDP